jgi:hypothetical protein
MGKPVHASMAIKLQDAARVLRMEIIAASVLAQGPTEARLLALKLAHLQ